jgi:hypothetical protein
MVALRDNAEEELRYLKSEAEGKDRNYRRMHEFDIKHPGDQRQVHGTVGELTTSEEVIGEQV